MIELYVYYRVRAENAERLAALVRTMQARLGAGSLKRRPGEQDGQQTWMEVYPAAGEEFAAVLDDAVAQAGISQFIEGMRHTEVFTDLN